ncbi:hypothetical protein EDC04DRAFT_2867989 [Pisolithus marmoratus]|nr:hypothetical protein EDC04DRAFT_2867989 [Pisolithus marmoratus]
MAYVPECAYADERGENHIYDEMWTGDWWWDMQGAVVAPVILSSDKTSLSIFSGDKKAWPVYLTIGNISKDMRCQVSAHATVLIGYLPVLRLECSQKKTCSLAGCHGREMVLHPILAAYITNFPKQCLVACNKENCCPCCLVKLDKCEGLHMVYKPFWKALPFMDIFTCITPNILHQLHKGIFHDHLLQWCTSLMGEKEINIHFQAMTHFPTLHHFKKGISTISQWTSTAHKEMQ